MVKQKTMNKNNVSRGDVFIAEFNNESGHRISGRRPCIILRKFGALTTVVPVSSKIDRLHWTEMILSSESSGLRKLSKAKVSQIQPLDESDLIQKIGILSEEEYTQIIKLLSSIFV